MRIWEGGREREREKNGTGMGGQGKEMDRRTGRPGAFHDVLGAGALHDDLVAEADAFAEYEQVERVGEVVAVHHGVLQRVRGRECDATAGARREQLGYH